MDIQTIGLFLFCFPVWFPLSFGLFWLIAGALRDFSKSRLSWVASVLVLPHFASKLMDRIYDAVVAGDYGAVFLLSATLALVVIGLWRLLKPNLPK